MTIIRSLLTFVIPYWRLAVGALIMMILVTATNLATPQLIRSLIDDGITAENWGGIVYTTVGLVLVAMTRGIFSFLNAYWAETTSQSVAFDLREALFAKLGTLSFSYHDQHQTGQLITRATSDVEGVRNFLATGILQLISAVLTFLASATILFVTDWRLALAALSTIPLIIGLFVWLFGQLGPRFRRVQQELGNLNTVLQENLAGVRVVKTFTAEERELALYRDQNEMLYTENLGTVRLFSIGFPTVFFLSNVGTFIVIWYGGNLVIDQELSLGTLVAFNSYLAFLLMPIFQLGFISQQLSRATASGGRILDVLDAPNDIMDKQDAVDLPHPTPGHVIFDNVHFHYPGAEDAALKLISFDVRPGDTVAIVGTTGSGKSSLIYLIPRFYDVTEGAVYIDAHDVRDLNLNSLRSQIGIVLQDVNLISGTIRENIAYGKPDATHEEVEQAARLAQAHDFILEQPDGYDTVIGERGVGLSGGQRQRVAIARALLVKPHMLIFDDSMSAVDAETEAKLQEALAPLLRDCTTFIIAQRISTVRAADTIFVMDEGNIVANGKHEELLHASPLYVEILDSQLEADEPSGCEQGLRTRESFPGMFAAAEVSNG